MERLWSAANASAPLLLSLQRSLYRLYALLAGVENPGDAVLEPPRLSPSKQPSCDEDSHGKQSGSFAGSSKASDHHHHSATGCASSVPTPRLHLEQESGIKRARQLCSLPEEAPTAATREADLHDSVGAINRRAPPGWCSPPVKGIPASGSAVSDDDVGASLPPRLMSGDVCRKEGFCLLRGRVPTWKARLRRDVATETEPRRTFRFDANFM